jgi:hypothetical protein
MLFEIERHPDTLVIRRRLRSRIDLPAVVLNIVFDVFVVVVVAATVVHNTWAEIGLVVSSLPVLALLWTWHTLHRLYNTTTISITPDTLVCHTGPIPWLALNTRLPLDDVRTFTIDTEAITAAGNRTFTAYHLLVVLNSGAEMRLSGDILSRDEASTVRDQLTTFRQNRTPNMSRSTQ